MKSRAVRVTLFALFLVAVGASAYLFWMADSQARVEVNAARSFDAQAQAAARAVGDLRLAQQGYVAAGQGDQFWSAKADEAAAAARDALARLRAEAVSAAAQTEVDSASAALQDFLQMDRRARDYARSGQKLLASDLVFSDGLELTQGAATAIERARLAEIDARAAAVTTLHRRQLYALGAAAAAATLILLLLVPSGASPVQSTTELAQSPASGVRIDEGPDLGLALDSVADSWSAPRRSAAPPAVDIGAVASVCTELARVGDTRALPAAMERAAAVLDASGIVLWIADPDGRELAPIVTHGYAPQIVTRLGTIARDAENATAAAFRTSLLQTVKSDAVSSGAIAAPLLTATGCVGVMAAEVRGAGEQQEAKLAAATIVAAQLATLVGPPSTRAQGRGAEAAGA